MSHGHPIRILKNNLHDASVVRSSVRLVDGDGAIGNEKNAQADDDKDAIKPIDEEVVVVAGSGRCEACCWKNWD